MTTRAHFRNLARAALAADARMGAFTQLSAWTGNIDAKILPVLGVVTPQERITPETLQDFQRSTLLQVVVKRAGGDELEDLLDADADAVEAAICPALLGTSFHCVPEDLTIALNGDGERRIGTAVVGFRILWFRRLGG